jgi:hypothetical protein
MVVYGFFWKAARDEVYFLCGNFSAGVKYSDVTRQLDTAYLSNYVKVIDDNGLKILFSSKVNFSFYTCTIKIDKKGKVSEAGFS